MYVREVRVKKKIQGNLGEWGTTIETQYYH